MSLFTPEATAAFSVEMLQELWATKLGNSRSRGRDGLAPQSMSATAVEGLIVGVSRRLIDGTYAFRPYRQVLRTKGAHKPPRIISIPGASDRLAMLAVAKFLRQTFAWIDHPRPQPLVIRVRQALRTGTNQDFVRLDVQNFYASIAHAPLLARLQRAEVPEPVVDLVRRAITEPTLANGETMTGTTNVGVGVPVGTSLANILGEISLSDVDATLSARTEWAYFRYVDDVLVLTQHGRRTEARGLIAAKLQEMGLRVHPKAAAGKSSSGKLRSANFDYLGYTFEPGRITVSRQRRTRLIDHLVRPVTAFQRGLEEGSIPAAALQERCQWWLNLRITGCYSGRSRRGWLPYYSQIDDMRVLHELDGVVAGFIRRLPLASQFTPKKFVKAWTLLRDPSRDKDDYILDFDKEWTEPEMQEALRRAGHQGHFLTGGQLNAAFYRLVHAAVEDLEHDVWSLS
jgi:RNA-directed DNA polymerase